MLKKLTALFFTFALVVHAVSSGIAFADEYEAPDEVAVEYEEGSTLAEGVGSNEYDPDLVEESEEVNTDGEEAEGEEEPEECDEEDEECEVEAEECDEEDEECNDVEAWEPEQEDAFAELVDENRATAAIASAFVLVANAIIEDEDALQDLKDSLEVLVDEYEELEAEFAAITEEVENSSITFEDASERMAENTNDFEYLIEEFEEVLPFDGDEWNAEQRAEFEELVARIEALFLSEEEVADINEVIENVGAHPLGSILSYFLYEHDNTAEYFAAFIALIEDVDGLDFEETMEVLEEFATDLENFTDFLRNAMRLAPSAQESSYNSALDHLFFLADLFAAAAGTRYNSRDDVVVLNVNDCDFELTVGALYELRDNVRPALRDAIDEYEDVYFDFLDGYTTVEGVLAVTPALNEEFDALIEYIEDTLGLTIDCEPIEGEDRPGQGNGRPPSDEDDENGSKPNGEGDRVLPQTGIATSSTAIAGIALAGIGTAIFVIKKRKSNLQ